ncbi:MAG: hypothetical protein JW806_02370 [Sedimentisphaerales bacterium]|nr:hypothetical protein [Sedimentisphaerales bacterium]
MLEIVNRFVLFIAMGVIGYLTYTALSETAIKLEKGAEEMPKDLKKILVPAFVESHLHNSPVNRNPFIIGKDDYFNPATSTLAKQSGKKAASKNSVGKLMGIVIGADGHRLALIDSEIRRVGSLVELPDSDALWEIQSISDKEVVLTNEGKQVVLRIPGLYMDHGTVGTDTTKVKEMDAQETEEMDVTETEEERESEQ